jgi:hypothetical protein
MNWLKQRKNEPTTYIGLALIAQGLGALFNFDGAPVVADTITAAAEPMARGDYATTATVVLGGLLGVFMREKH